MALFEIVNVATALGLGKFTICMNLQVAVLWQQALTTRSSLLGGADDPECSTKFADISVEWWGLLRTCAFARCITAQSQQSKKKSERIDRCINYYRRGIRRTGAKHPYSQFAEATPKPFWVAS